MDQNRRRFFVVCGLLLLVLVAYGLSLVALTFFLHPNFQGPRFWNQVLFYASDSWKGFFVSLLLISLTGGRSVLFEKRPIVQFFKSQSLVIITSFLTSLMFFQEQGLLSDLQSSDLSVVLSLVSFGLSQGARATLICLPVSVPSAIVLVWLIRRW